MTLPTYFITIIIVSNLAKTTLIYQYSIVLCVTTITMLRIIYTRLASVMTMLADILLV